MAWQAQGAELVEKLEALIGLLPVPGASAEAIEAAAPAAAPQITTGEEAQQALEDLKKRAQAITSHLEETDPEFQKMTLDE